MLRLMKLPVVFAPLLCASIAIAQSTVGELLDADAKRLSWKSSNRRWYSV